MGACKNIHLAQSIENTFRETLKVCEEARIEALDVHNVDLTILLVDMSRKLSDVGKKEESLLISRHAARFSTSFARLPPNTCDMDLARSLDTLR